MLKSQWESTLNGKLHKNCIAHVNRDIIDVTLNVSLRLKYKMGKISSSVRNNGVKQQRASVNFESQK